VVGRIDGSVKMKEREKILARVRIVLMTPDVCHAWVMSNLANPIVKEFVKHLGLVVLDEAHTLEGIFGSNFAFLREHGMEALALPFRSARSRHKSPYRGANPAPGFLASRLSDTQRHLSIGRNECAGRRTHVDDM
jgi:hypothetical protein